MFYHLDGKVAELGQGMAVIDCSGVGYLVNVSLNTLAQLKNGERAKLYISESVREDAFELFGFASKSEKRSFDLLIGVSGVGPKAALSILSAHTPEALSMAILSGDEKALTVAPGIGKKIAQRVIRELHIEHVHILERHPHAVGIFLIEFKRIGEERDIAQANGVQRNGVRLLTVFVAFHRGQRRGVRHGVIRDFFCR